MSEGYIVCAMFHYVAEMMWFAVLQYEVRVRVGCQQQNRLKYGLAVDWRRINYILVKYIWLLRK